MESIDEGNVFRYFEEISRIPRGSGNVRAISDYLAAFARERGLVCVQDEAWNVTIVKEATAGYEGCPGVILQGHMDMVCERAAGSSHDFLTEGLALRRDGDFLYAEGTTLGGDDGIAIAYILAILDDDAIVHPRIEAVLTSDEEVGLLGAARLDMSGLRGSYLINMDSEEEGVILAGCAGGMTACCVLPLSYERARGVGVTVSIRRLRGGHSGSEIGKRRANANVLAGRLLWDLRDLPLSLRSIAGGTKDNAIPREATLELVMEEGDIPAFLKRARLLEERYRREMGASEPGLEVAVLAEDGLTTHGRMGASELGLEVAVLAEDGSGTAKGRIGAVASGGSSGEGDAFGDTMGNPELFAMDAASKERVTFFLLHAPNGVQAMSGSVEGLVESSLNLGVLRVTDRGLLAHFGIRSSFDSYKSFLGDRLAGLTAHLGGSCELSGDYPGWEYREDSRLRDLYSDAYFRVTGKRPGVEIIHAGLECGVFAKKREDLDMISIGPDMRGVHTTEERLSVSSARRVYAAILETLRSICEEGA